jgi:hypothetical protein
MALNGTLTIEGKKYNVQDCDYEFSQPYDNNYKPSAIPRGGLINFSILSNNKDDLFFHEWMLSIADVHSGEFELPVTCGIEHKWKNVKFENAHCIRLSESFSNSNALQMHMRITIVAAKIDFGNGVEFRNKEIKI